MSQARRTDWLLVLLLVPLLTVAAAWSFDQFRVLRTSAPLAAAPANDPAATKEAAVIAAGREQFTRVRHADVAADPNLTSHRLFNARSCAECHKQAGVGGGGPFENNVEMLDAVSSQFDPMFAEAFGPAVGPRVLHRHSSAPAYARWRATLVLDRMTQGISAATAIQSQFMLTLMLGNSLAPSSPAANPPLDSAPQFPVPILPTTFTNPLDGIPDRELFPSLNLVIPFEQRNTPPLFGLGLLESIPQSAIDAVAERQSPHVRGRSPRLQGGGFGRFGWKANTATLAAFNENACAVELGLTTPKHVPATVRAASLRSGLRPNDLLLITGFDEPFLAGQFQPLPLSSLRARRAPPSLRSAAAPSAPDMSEADVAALTRFVASLPAPRQVVDPARARQVAEGERHFHAIGCAQCHTPDLGGVSGVYSDLLLHRVGTSSGSSFYGGSGFPSGDPEFDLVQANEFRTPPLWGAADSAPYLHDGSAHTLDAAIRRHTEQALESNDKYQMRLDADQRQALLAFLGSLRAP